MEGPNGCSLRLPEDQKAKIGIEGENVVAYDRLPSPPPRTVGEQQRNIHHSRTRKYNSLRHLQLLLLHILPNQILN